MTRHPGSGGGSAPRQLRDGPSTLTAFVERLASAAPTSPRWRQSAACLVVLRLVERWLQPPVPTAGVPSERLRAAEREVDRLDADSRLGRLLGDVLHHLRASLSDASAANIRALGDGVMACGRELESDAEFTAAIETYSTAQRVFTLLDDPERGRLQAELGLRLGFVRRELGDFEGSLESYRRAAAHARRGAWREGELRAELGEAKVVAARGDLPEAERRTASIVERAAREGVVAAQAYALHELGTLVGMQGRVARAVTYCFEAYQLAALTEIAERHAALADIAFGLGLLGLRDASREVQLLLARRGATRRIRWVAATNLIELAIEGGDVATFEEWRAWLDREPMTPFLLAEYQLELGYGRLALGRLDEAGAAFRRALAIAEEYGYGRLIFAAEGALKDLDGARRQRLAHGDPPGDSDAETDAVAEIASTLRAQLAAT